MTGMSSHTNMAIGWMIVEIFIIDQPPPLALPVKGRE